MNPGRLRVSLDTNRFVRSSKRTPVLAILLAAGRGNSLRPLTDTTPKPLLTFGRHAIIDYIFDALEKAQIHQVIMVTNYLENQLRTYVTKDFSQRFSITFCHQKEILGSANALSSTHDVATRYISTGRPLLISATDYVMPVNYLRNLVRFHRRHDVDISVSLRNIPPTQAVRSSRIVENTNSELVRIIEKPEDHVTGPAVAASLIYIVPPSVFDYVDKCCRSKRGEFELPEVINLMIDGGFRARGFLQPNLVDLDLALKSALGKERST